MVLLTFLPLSEAASKLGLSEAELRSRVESGTIAAGKLPDGEIVVSITTKEDDINARLSAIKREDFKHLRGNPITVSEAAKKYGEKYGVKLIGQTIRDWVKRGYIQTLRESSGRGSYMELDEADVAYCAAIHAVRKQYKTRAPLLKEDGSPYLLMHPNLAKARRLVKAKNSILP